MQRALKEFFQKYLITDLDVQLCILRMWKDNYWISKSYPLNLTSKELDDEITFLSNFIINILLNQERIDHKGGDP